MNAPASNTQDPTQRPLSGAWLKLVQGLGIAFVSFYIYSTVVDPVGPQFHRGVYVMVTLVLGFLLYQGRKTSRSDAPTPVDVVWIILSIGVTGYWIFNFETLNLRAGAETSLDYLMSVVGLVVVIEVARRVLGWPLVTTSFLALGFVFLGPYLPHALEHGGFELKETATFLFLSTNGVFGMMANILATYVILFIFFGAFLGESGAARFFIDFPMALAGRTVGGPAKVSVLASALFGSVSGSAIANTVSTGTFTIPLMKKSGFKPHVAGAVEPAASIGGMFLPPIMGAGGFIMAELTEMPYRHIMLVALFPALIYFFSVFLMVHFEAKKNGLKGMAGDLPEPWSLLRKDWPKAAPLITITVMMMMGKSPGFAAVVGIFTCILVSWLQPETRMGPQKILKAMVAGAQGTLIIGATVGVIGIIVGVIEMTGVGLQFSHLMISAGESVTVAHLVPDGLSHWLNPQVFEVSVRKVVLIFLIALASLVLGMGAPVTAAYLITVVLVAPVLTEVGVSLIAAHMVVYWFSQDSNITPPVCVAAYAGAAIAGANPWKTGWTSFKYAKMLYVMPMMFVFVPESLLIGDPLDIGRVMLGTLLGTIGFCAATQGYFHGTLGLWGRLLFLGLAILCFVGYWWSMALAIVVAIGASFLGKPRPAS